MGTSGQAGERRAGIVDAAKAVGASFFGVRGRRSHERDFAKLNPLHVILVGLAAAALFVAALVLVVKAVVP
jgi:hypothetical protein